MDGLRAEDGVGHTVNDFDYDEKVESKIDTYHPERTEFGRLGR